MKTLRIEQGDRWVTRYSLRKEKQDYILKCTQYQLKGNNPWDKVNSDVREIHLFGKDAVKKLRDFLKVEVRL